MRFSTRVIRMSLAVAALTIGSATFAQTYPARTVSIITPFPPGGAADVVCDWSARN